MSLDRLREQILEYHLRVEEVLSGMDHAITSLGNRVGRMEERIEAITSPSGGEPHIVAENISELRHRIATLGEAVTQMMSDKA